MALTAFRVVVGPLFIFHGTTKILGFPTGAAISMGTWPAWWAGLLELVLGLLVTIGLFTRVAAFVVSGEMAIAYFWVHAPRGFWPYPESAGGNGGEVVILYCFAFLLLAIVGAGTISVDSLRRRESLKSQQQGVIYLILVHGRRDRDRRIAMI